MAETARIRVTRHRRGWFARFLPYAVMVDDREEGRLPRGGTVEVDVAPGDHRVRVEVGGVSSPEWTVPVGAGAVVDLHCRPMRARDGKGPIAMRPADLAAVPGATCAPFLGRAEEVERESRMRQLAAGDHLVTGADGRELRVFAYRSGFRAYHALSEDTGTGSSDDWVLLVALPPLWLVSRIWHSVRFRGGWSVAVLRTRRYWKNKVLRTERFRSEDEAKARAAALAAELAA